MLIHLQGKCNRVSGMRERLGRVMVEVMGIGREEGGGLESEAGMGTLRRINK